MAVIHLLGWDNKSGLSLDRRILQRTLEQGGHEVVPGTLHLPRRGDRVRTFVSGLRRARYDLNLFIENVEPAWLGHARRNAVIPNPEWWGHPPALLRRLDRVLCKTRSAMPWFDWYGARTEYIGFTSEDRRDASRTPVDQLQPLHVAGASNQKGTAPLVALWAAHPEWPVLTVVAHFRPEHDVLDWSRPNVRHLSRRLDDDTLRALQNAAGIHLCPSDAEGYGHTLAEAMSCAALVVTNDAPPMNELITEERGVLAGVAGIEPMRLGFRARADPAALAGAIERALRMDPGERWRRGQAARAWFETNDAAFPGRLLNAVARLVS